jgi:hypothetical protein
MKRDSLGQKTLCVYDEHMYRIPIITCTLYIPIQPAIARSPAQSMLNFKSKILNYVHFEWEDSLSVVPEQLHRAGSLLACFLSFLVFELPE